MVLFNYFNFEYTGLTVSYDSCYNKGYSCCSSGSGQGDYYFSLENTCSQGQECWDYCQNSEQKQGGLITTRATFQESVNDFFDEFKKVFTGIFKGGAVGSGGKCISKPGKQSPIGRECPNDCDSYISVVCQGICNSHRPICEWDEGSCFATGYTCEAASTQSECEDSGYSLLCDWQIARGTETCGNNIKEGDEECDGSALGDNGNCYDQGYDYGALSCNEDCTYDRSQCYPQQSGGGTETCGNNIKEGDEECDGSALGDNGNCYDQGYDYGALSCNEDCTYDRSQCYPQQSGGGTETCGDGIIQEALGEECDGGNTRNSDGCSSVCTFERLQAPSFTNIELKDDGILLTWDTSSINYISGLVTLERNKITGNTIKDTFDNIINFFKRLFGFQVVGINLSEIKGFKIYRITESNLFPDDPIYLNKENANCNNQGECSYLDTRTLINGVTYYYKISAVDNNDVEGESSQQIEINYQTTSTSSISEIPVAPSNLEATTVSQTDIRLQWQDNSDDEQGFKIERSPSSTFIPILETLTTRPSISAYGSYGLTPASTHWYRVKAFNAEGESSYSNSVSATTRTQTTDTQSPTSDISYPQNNKYYNSSQIGGVILGSASDDVGVSKVEIYVKNLNTSDYWNGNVFSSQQVFLLTMGDTSNSAQYGWYYNLQMQELFTENNAYQICSKATDSSNNVQLQLSCISFTYATTIIPPPPETPSLKENDYSNGCNNNDDDDGDGIYDGLDRDCAVGEKVTIQSITLQDTKPFEESEFEIQCKIAIQDNTQTTPDSVVSLFRAQPCVFANLSTKTTSQLCEFQKRTNDILRFKCDAGNIGNKLTSCQVDLSRCNGEIVDLRKNKAEKYINITTPNLCGTEVGKERLSINNIDFDDKEYKVNEKIKLEVEIENLDNEDLDVVVESYLYDLNTKKELTKTTQNKIVEEGLSSEEFKSELITPGVPESKYKLYFKAYLKNEEDEICIVSSREVRIKASTTTSGSVCGDGVLGGNEKCDDGNTRNNDGCSSVCDLEDNTTITCTSGQTRECGLNIGVCKKGVQTCTNSSWKSCIGEVPPSQEICNDLLDNNCNGLTDCSDSACSTSQTCTGTSASEDSDRDGLLDEWELNYFDNLNAQSGEDDFDNDGFTNAQEYAKSTDPTDPSSAPKESSTLIIVIVVVLILIIAGVLVWLFALRPKKPVAGLPPTRTNIKIAPSSKVNPALSGYIKTSLQKGYTRQQIKNALLVKGWGEKEIDDAFKYF